MIDFSMCTDKKCPRRKQCYRFMATPDKFQSYVVSGRSPMAKKCVNFILRRVKNDKN